MFICLKLGSGIYILLIGDCAFARYGLRGVLIIMGTFKRGKKYSNIYDIVHKIL